MSENMIQDSIELQALFGYSIVRLLGRGSGSRVYLGLDPTTGQHRAIKHVLRTRRAGVAPFQQLRDELAAGRQIHHPAVRRCFDLRLRRAFFIGKVEQAVLLMDYFDGYPLNRVRFRKLPRLLDCFIHLAEAIRAVHQAGLVHGDLRPQNILINDADELRLIDLGQACAIGTIRPAVSHPPEFIAPEHAKGGPMILQTDVFNFGATLYSSLARSQSRKHFNNGLLTADGQLPRPTTLGPDVPEALSELITRCTQPATAQRPQDLAEVLETLRAIRRDMATRTERQDTSDNPDASARSSRDASLRLRRESKTWVPASEWRPTRPLSLSR